MVTDSIPQPLLPPSSPLMQRVEALVAESRAHFLIVQAQVDLFRLEQAFEAARRSRERVDRDLALLRYLAQSRKDAEEEEGHAD